MRILSRSEIEDLIVGATILGVGGGGDPEKGLTSVFDAVSKGGRVVLVDVEELGDDWVVASPYYVGSVAPQAEGVEKRLEDPIYEAVMLFERAVGARMRGVVASEIGGGNTGAALAIAAKLGLPIVDGDLMGRAGPELHQSTANVFGFPMTPAALVSQTGNRVVVYEAASIDDYEAVARHLSVVSRVHVAVVDTPLKRSQAERCVIKGTLTRCIRIGEARRKALKGGENPVSAVVSQLRNGRVVFEGVVEKYDWRDEAGFLVGEVEVRGEGLYGGRKLRTWIKNEHIMCWVDGEPAIMPPDLIVFLDPRTGLGITNDRLAVGRRVVVAGASAEDVWRTKRGLELFGPKHFGFNYEYVPFEELRTPR